MSLTPPIIQFFEFNTREVASPSGYRYLVNGSFAFNSVLASGCSKYTTRGLPASSGVATSGTLYFPGTKFDLTDNDKDYLASRPVAVVVHLASSGVGIGNLRFFMSEDTAITIPAQSVGLPPGFVQYAVSGIWQPNCVLPSGAGTRLARGDIPSFPNVSRQDGVPVLVGEDDRNVSQYIYMNLILPVGFPLGTYGICGSGNLRFGLAYDYFFNGYILEFGGI